MEKQVDSLKYKTKKGLYWKFSEQFAGYATQFIVGIIMARLLSPHDFGTAAIPVVFLSIAQVFVDGSFGLALIRKPEVTEKDLSTSFYYGIIVGLVCYIILFSCSPYIAVFYNEPILKHLIRITALTFLFNPLYTPQSVILNRRLDFKTPAKIQILIQIISGAAGITAAYLNYGIWALVVASLVSSVLNLLLTWYAVKWVPKERFSKKSFIYLWDFGNKMMVVRLMQTLYANIIPLIVGKSYGTRDLGIYNRAKGFASLPSSNIGGVLNSVTFPVLSKMQSDGELLGRNYRKMIRVSSFLVFPIMMLMCALAHPIIVALVTDKWIDSVILLQLMCFTYMLQPAQILNLNFLQVKGRTDLTMKLEFIKKGVYTVAIVVSIQFGLVVLCVADFFLTLFALFINTYYTGKFINVGFVKQVKDMLPHFFLSMVMLVVVFLFIQLFSSVWLQLILGGIVGLVFYFGMALLLKFDEFADLKYMLNRNR